MALEKIKPRVVDETQNYTFNNVTATGNIVSLNANLGNLATANFVSGTLTTSAQPNITTVGSLGDLTVVGIAAVGNLRTDNLLYANGVPWPLGGVTATVGGSNSQVQFNDGGVFGAVANFTFDKTSNTLVTDYFVGSGSGLSNLTAGNINGQVSNAAIASVVYSSSQPNITSVGTLTTLSVAGNITTGNADLGNLATANFFSGNGSGLGSIVGANVTGAVSYATTANSVSGSNVTGAVTYAATANAVAGANVLGAVSYATTANSVAGANVTGYVANANHANVADSANAVAGANVSGEVSYAATANAVAGANVSGQVGYAAVANSVAGANVSGAVSYATTANSVAGANVSGQVGNAVVASTVYTNAQPNITSVGTLTNLAISGNIDTDGNAHVGGNLTVTGNITFSGNGTINQITGNSGQFYGNAQGVGALYAGLSTGYSAVYNPIIQASADANDYVQINFQNINHGNKSSTDYVATADNGTDTTFFIDMGIAGGSWDGTQDNSLGNALYADDGYVYVQGNAAAGNLVIGTATSGTNIKFIAGGPNTGNIRATIDSTGLNVAGSVTGVNAHFTGSNVNLGNVGNVKITGGSSGYILQTDGTGNLEWVDNLPSTTAYTANSIALTNGVYVSGNVTSIQSFGDYASGNVYVLTDGTGSAPAWYVDIDFITVASFNRVVLNINYTQSSGHTIYVQLYNNSTSAWDSIGTYTGLGSYYAFALQVIDGAPYISSGRVQLRLYHSNGGSALHTTSIDYAGLELSNQGPQGPKGSTGATGAAGNGVATGGTTGQVLIKNSGTNYDTAWSSSISLAGDAGIGGNLTVTGNLTVNGTTTSINSTIVEIDDLAIVVANDATTSSQANGAGIIINGASANMLYINTSNSLTFSHKITAPDANLGNLVTANYFSGNGSGLSSIAGGNVTGTVANATYATAAGTVGVVTASSQPNITSVGTLTSLDVTGNITGGNANLGNSVTANYFYGNGVYLTGLTSSGMANGTSNVSIPAASGNVNISVAGNANVFKVTGTGVNVAGTGNFSGGITAGANINAGTNYILGNGYYLTDVITGVGDTIANGNSNITVYGTTVGISANATSNVMLVQKTGVNVSGYINTTGNLVAGNANLGNLATANFFQGNGSLLTGITVSAGNSILNGNSNVSVIANANVNISSTGNANVVVITGTGMNVAGTVNATGNITAAYLIGNGSQLTGISAGSSLISGNSNVILDANANLRISITSTANVVTVSTTGVNVAGNLTATGNTNLGNSVTSNFFIGNGSLLTGIGGAGYIFNGNSNVNIGSANANVTISVANTANVVVVSTNTVAVNGNVTAGNVYANAGTIGAQAIVGTLSTGNQYNVTNVGTLGNLAVTSNITAANITLTGNIYANSGIIKGQYLKGDGSNITGIGGAGYIFSGTSNVAIPTANGNVYVTVGNSANLFVIHDAGANITGNANITGFVAIGGNVTAANASLGNTVSANYFVGNLYGQANTAATVTASSQPNITSVGNLTSITVEGVANLGTLSNVKIGGGASGYFLKTDGSGNLSWAVPAGGGGSGGTSLTYTAGTTPPASGNILGDQWYNTSSNVLYEYISDGTASYWVDVSTPSTTTTEPGTLDLSTVTIPGGTAGQFLTTDGTGTLSFATVSTSSISNGNSNVTVSANGDVTISSAGTSNVLVVSDTTVTVSGITDLGNASNLRISGGANNQVLTSNGAGGATWQEPQNSIHPFLLMGA